MLRKKHSFVRRCQFLALDGAVLPKDQLDGEFPKEDLKWRLKRKETLLACLCY